MKNAKLYLLLLLSALMLNACGSDDDEPNPKPNDDPTQPTELQEMDMNIYTLIGSNDLNHPTPRMVVEWGEHMVAQVNDPNNNQVMMFQYANSHPEYDAAVLVSKHNVIFMHYNPLTDKAFPSDALIVGDYDDFSSLSTCTIDWATNEITYLQSVPLSSNVKANRTSAIATRGDNDDIKKPFFDMLDDIGEGVGKIKNVVSKLGPAGKSAAALCDAWTGVMIPIMRYQLYDDDVIGQRQYVEDMFVSQVMSISIKYICKVTGVRQEDVNMALWAYDLAERITDKTNPNRQVDQDTWAQQGRNAAMGYADNVEQADALVNTTLPLPSPNSSVAVSVNLGLVTETTISLSGSVKISDSMYASYVSAGYVYYVGNKEQRIPTGITSDFAIKPCTISNLQPGTTYSVAAYYETTASSKPFYSNFITVTTLGQDEDNQWEGTKWLFNGVIRIEDSDGEVEGGDFSFGIDLTDLNNITFTSLDGLMVAINSITHEIAANGDLIIMLSGTDHTHTFTLHRLSATQATLTWSGASHTTSYIAVLKQTNSYTSVWSGNFNGLRHD